VLIQLTPISSTDMGLPGLRTTGYVLAGVGAVGLLSFGVFGVLGYRDQHRLEQESGQSGVANDYALADSMHRKYMVADVSLGISLVSLGAATYLLLSTHDSARGASSIAKTALYLNGLVGGGGLGVKGEF